MILYDFCGFQGRVWKFRSKIFDLCAIGMRVKKLYCELIADIYEDSHFEVICGQHLSKEFPLPVGTKTGDPLSAVLFIIVLDKSLKEVQ